MADSSKFDFCPMCGAPAQNGACQNCGYTGMQGTMPQQNAYGQQIYAAPVQGGNAKQNVYGQQIYTAPVQERNIQQNVYGQQIYTAPVQTGNMPRAAYGQQVYTGWQNGYVQQNAVNQNAVLPKTAPQKGNGPAIVIILLLIVLLLTVAALFLGIHSIMSDSKDKNNEEVTGDISVEETVEASEDIGTGDEITPPKETNPAETMPSTENKLQGIYYHDVTDTTEENLQEAGQDTSLPYYSGPYHAVDHSLSYDVSFRKEMLIPEEESKIQGVYLLAEYPQVSSDVLYAETVNEALRAEYEHYYGFFTESFERLMSESADSFYCEINSYVTYMDEKLLSVVFKEDIYFCLAGEAYTGGELYCVNIDLESGRVLENTEILQMDEAFVADFRNREIRENGEGALTGYTDEEILKMLKDPAYLVAFYTPYGMEIGLNLSDIIVYVMYDDYQNFINTY